MSRRSVRRTRPAWACLFVGLLCVLAVGCGGSNDDDGDRAGAGNGQGRITLRMIDNITAGSPGLNEATNALVAQYEKEHPNIEIERASKTFNDYQATARLEATGPNPPDIIQGNIGLSLDGPLVKAGALLSLEKYDEKYGWTDRFGEAGLQPFRFRADGSTWGEGNLYGVSSQAELVWVFYNKSKLAELGLEVPKTFGEFEAALAKAKEAGETPIMLGNKEQFPATHVYSAILNAMAPADAIRRWALSQDGATFDTPENVAAAEKLADWAETGYFTPGFSGLSYDSSLARFGKGEGVFRIDGTWALEPVAAALKDNAGAFLLPTASGAIPAVTGGLADPWHISSKSEHPDEAADFINAMVDVAGAKVHAKYDALPSGSVSLDAFPDGSLAPEAVKALGEALEADALVPYLDFPTPTIGAQTLLPLTQELMAKRVSAQDYVSRIQDAWTSGREQ